MNRFLWPLGIFMVLVALLAVGLKLDPREVPSPLIGHTAPGFLLPVLGSDKNFSPENWRGQVWLLNVWASWCVSCRQEHPLLMDLKEQLQGLAAPVGVVGLNYKEVRGDSALAADPALQQDRRREQALASQRASAWLATHGNPYTLSVLDVDGRVAMDYGVYGVPETYVIDKMGVIRLKHIGPVTVEVITTKILPLIQELNK